VSDVRPGAGAAGGDQAHGSAKASGCRAWSLTVTTIYPKMSAGAEAAAEHAGYTGVDQGMTPSLG